MTLTDHHVAYDGETGPLAIIGTVEDHTALGLTPPEPGMVWVMWEEVAMRWEYEADLVIVP